MAEDAGGRARIEELLERWARAYEIMELGDSDDVPESVVEEMEALMGFGTMVERTD